MDKKYGKYFKSHRIKYNIGLFKVKIRDEITQEFHKSQGTVSNIIAKFRNEMSHYDFDAMRTLGKELRQLEMTPNNCAMGFRIFKILQKLKIPETKKIE
ncbi:MAG: hypothetical protein ACRD8K_04775 [Nitrososphaeraceae archaeon]